MRDQRRVIGDEICYAVCIAIGGEAVRGHSEFVGKAHKTPRWWLKPRGRDRGGRAGRKPRPRPSPASYAVHEAETVMSGRGRESGSFAHSESLQSSKPAVCLDQNKQNNQGGWSVGVGISVSDGVKCQVRVGCDDPLDVL